jgi:hypothetical protein
MCKRATARAWENNTRGHKALEDCMICQNGKMDDSTDSHEDLGSSETRFSAIKADAYRRYGAEEVDEPERR